jgi:hypothetical protein|tara:strand:- start:598 stop:1578 length:981 start_codon:yes stop_codon:yes gene_type:complete
MMFNALGARASLWIRRLIFGILIENRLAKLLRLPMISSGIPTLAGLYLVSYELFRTDWAVFYHHPTAHLLIIKISISLTVIFALFQGFFDSWGRKRIYQYIDLLHNFIRMVGSVVAVKDRRCKENAASLSSDEDIFLSITHPQHQINIILDAATECLVSNFILNIDDLRFTIIEQTQLGWDYAFDTQPSWQADTTDGAKLLKANSAARQCFETGEAVFLHDKQIASAKGNYSLSSRDERKGNGSVFCYKITGSCCGATFNNVVSIATYNNKMLASGYDDVEIERVTTLLKEICRRIELELTLRFIRNWKEKMVSNTSLEVTDEQPQ